MRRIKATGLTVPVPSEKIGGCFGFGFPLSSIAYSLNNDQDEEQKWKQQKVNLYK